MFTYDAANQFGSLTLLHEFQVAGLSVGFESTVKVSTVSVWCWMYVSLWTDESNLLVGDERGNVTCLLKKVTQKVDALTLNVVMRMDYRCRGPEMSRLRIVARPITDLVGVLELKLYSEKDTPENIPAHDDDFRFVDIDAQESNILLMQVAIMGVMIGLVYYGMVVFLRPANRRNITLQGY